MKKEIKQKWVAALRSGENKQGRGYLSRETITGEVEHCCLGVLCQIAVSDGVIDPPSKLGSNVGFVYEGNERFTLPPTVREWAGLEADDPEIDPDEEVPATHRNDSGYTFEQIADLIEANL